MDLSDFSYPIGAGVEVDVPEALAAKSLHHCIKYLCVMSGLVHKDGAALAPANRHGIHRNHDWAGFGLHCN